MANLDLTPLVRLGLTRLEAEIYTFLLEHSPATGYRIAKGIGKPAANTYNALESLHDKGAIIIDDSDTRLCRAIPTEELLNNFQHQFETARNRANEEFRKLKESPGDSRIYQLKTTPQVLQRYRQMLERCRRVAVLDFFPYAVEQLKSDIVAAARRGVRITMKVYAPVSIAGVNIIESPEGESILEKWPGQWANGITDAQEYLLAFLSRDGKRTFQAVWSNNHFLSWIYYGGFLSELMAGALEEGINLDMSRTALRKIIQDYREMLQLEATGYKDAASFFIGPSRSKPGKRN